jgi:putative transposase
MDQRMQLPRLGTRKLYYLLTDLLEEHQLKIGRDGLFDLLRAEGMLIKPKKNYTKTTNSKHWLRKHPNLLKEVQPQSPDEV